MVAVKSAALAILLVAVLLVAYSLAWLHYNPISEEMGRKNVTFDERVVEFNASALPVRRGEWSPIGALRTVCVGNDVRACVGLYFSGKRNVGGTEIWIAAKAVVEAKPRNPSVRVLKAEIIVETFNNTLFGDMVPEDFVGAAVFKAIEGPFTVETKWCGDPNHVGCMVAVPEKPAWGKRLTFDAWPDFTIGGKTPTYSGNATFIVTVEYEVRTGFFTAEKREIILSLPIRIRVEGGGELT